MLNNPAYSNPKEQDNVLQDNPAYSGVVDEHVMAGLH